MEFLKSIVPDFIKDRHWLYKTHGYSFSTLQVVNDSKAHKENWNSGSVKITSIFKKYWFKHFDSNDIDLFSKSDKIYIYPDKIDKNIFKKILDHFKIEFKRSWNHENKQTDFLFKVGNQIFIMEHKHMKEAWGGQDKQMSEIINFISYTDFNVHYVSFLDGVYFNLLSDKSIKNWKPFIQRANIFESLSLNGQNYFINTFWFIKLIEELI
jgi:hypothetical protein